MVKKQKSIKKPTIVTAIESMTFWVGTPISIGIHTVFFIVSFLFILAGVSLDKILLVVTTIVSLEAIYLSLFIQFTVNQHTKSLQSVEEDIDDIQEDVDDIQEDIDDIQEDVEDVGEDIDKIQLEDKEEENQEQKDARVFAAIEHQLTKLGSDMTTLREEIQALKHKSNG